MISLPLIFLIYLIIQNTTFCVNGEAARGGASFYRGKGAARRGAYLPPQGRKIAQQGAYPARRASTRGAAERTASGATRRPSGVCGAREPPLLDIGYSIPSPKNMENLFKIPSSQALFNRRYKYYHTRDGEVLAEVMTFSREIFNPFGYEVCDGVRVLTERAKRFDNEDLIEESPNECSDKAWKRARRRAFDLMMCNSLDLFVTLTLDASKISRTEWGDIVPRFNTFLDNMVRRHGLRYILIPEFHADGRSIHFHGLMNSSALTLVNSGVKHHGKTVYNVENWKYGFTTAQRVGKTPEDQIKTAKYCFKYMTKAAGRKVGGRYFYHGGILHSPIFRYDNVDFSNAEGEIVHIDDVPLAVKIFRPSI